MTHLARWWRGTNAWADANPKAWSVIAGFEAAIVGLLFSVASGHRNYAMNVTAAAALGVVTGIAAYLAGRRRRSRRLRQAGGFVSPPR